MQPANTSLNPDINIYHFNIGGEDFSFAKSTLAQPHLKDSLLEMSASGRWEAKIPFLDVDPKIFRKWCAPYIRHNLIPSSEDFKNSYEIQNLIASANSVGLFALAELVKTKILDIKENRKIVRIMYKAGPNTDGTLYFHLIKNESNQCLAKSCETLRMISDFRHYFEAHNAVIISKIQLSNKKGYAEMGYIECTI